MNCQAVCLRLAMKGAPFSLLRLSLLVAPRHAVIPASPWRCHNRSQTPDAWPAWPSEREFCRVSPCAVGCLRVLCLSPRCGTIDASTQIHREHEATSVHAFRRHG